MGFGWNRIKRNRTKSNSRTDKFSQAGSTARQSIFFLMEAMATAFYFSGRQASKLGRNLPIEIRAARVVVQINYSELKKSTYVQSARVLSVRCTRSSYIISEFPLRAEVKKRNRNCILNLCGRTKRSDTPVALRRVDVRLGSSTFLDLVGRPFRELRRPHFWVSNPKRRSTTTSGLEPVGLG